MKYIIALFGESGSGKTTVERHLLEQNKDVKRITRISTRPMREGEEQGKPYLFTTNSVLQKMVLNDVESFIEVENQNEDWFYATHLKESFKDKSPVDVYVGCYSADSLNVLIDAEAITPDITVIPVRVNVDSKTRIMRQLMRENNPDCHEICRRYLKDSGDYAYFDFAYFEVDNNGEIKDTIAQLLEIIFPN